MAESNAEIADLASEMRELLRLEAEVARRRRYNRLGFYRPQPVQRDFHAAGGRCLYRLLMAGNQLGKTYAGAAEVAMHLTGRYPRAGQMRYWTEIELLHDLAATTDTMERQHLEGWEENLERLGLWGQDCWPDGWQGRRWDRGIHCWVAGNTLDTTRDTVQALLLGDPAGYPDTLGTGMIPRECIVGWTHRRAGGQNTADYARIRHASGAISKVVFKSYDQGRARWQGGTVDLIWIDEEPPHDVYQEALSRLNATRGSMLLTFTPLLGVSEVVRAFLDADQEGVGNER